MAIESLVKILRLKAFRSLRQEYAAAALLLFFLLVAALSAAGCASGGLPRTAVVPVEQFQPFIADDGERISPSSVSETVPDVDMLALDSRITALLDETVLPVRDPRKRLEALAAVLVQRVRYDTAEDQYGAKTARETFESGTGNCLSFSNLFVAMARYAGLKAGFQEVPVPPNWVRNGEVLFFTLHIGAFVDIYDHKDTWVQLDSVDGSRFLVWGSSRRYLFVPYELGLYNPDINPRLVRPVPDRRALAEYYNNIGAMHLAEADNKTAFRYFVKAIETDPKLNFAWSNLGVLYSRNGQSEAAEMAYLQGLSASGGPDDVTVMTLMSNMASLYRRTGEKDKAEYYEDEVAAFRERNPYYHYAVAQKAYYDARYAASVDDFKKAIRRKGDEPLFYYGLAFAYYRLGDLKNMSESFDKAKHYAWDDDTKEYYDRVKERLSEEIKK